MTYTSIPIVLADAERDSLKDLATTADRYLDPPGVDANTTVPETENIKEVSGSDEMGLSPPTSPGKSDRSQSREWGEFRSSQAANDNDVMGVELGLIDSVLLNVGYLSSH